MSQQNAASRGPRRVSAFGPRVVSQTCQRCHSTSRVYPREGPKSLTFSLGLQHNRRVIFLFILSLPENKILHVHGSCRPQQHVHFPSYRPMQSRMWAQRLTSDDKRVVNTDAPRSQFQGFRHIRNVHFPAESSRSHIVSWWSSGFRDFELQRRIFSTPYIASGADRNDNWNLNTRMVANYRLGICSVAFPLGGPRGTAKPSTGGLASYFRLRFLVLEQLDVLFELHACNCLAYSLYQAFCLDSCFCILRVAKGSSTKLLSCRYRKNRNETIFAPAVDSIT